MPCNSDYMQHDAREAESGRVLEFLKEVNGELFNHNNPSYYGRVATLDSDTAQLCSILGRMGDVSGLSLELQLWWRRHQEWDRIREQREVEARQRETTKAQALEKLTPEERIALGVKEEKKEGPKEPPLVVLIFGV